MPKDYSSLSADEATQKLGDFYGQQLSIITDKNRGVLGTLFSIVRNIMRQEYIGGLQDAVLEKNGIEKIKSDGPVCHNYTPEIVAAARARGSMAAEGIALYDSFTKACEAKAKETPGFEKMAQYRQVWVRVKISKTLPLR